MFGLLRANSNSAIPPRIVNNFPSRAFFGSNFSLRMVLVSMEVIMVHSREICRENEEFNLILRLNHWF